MADGTKLIKRWEIELLIGKPGSRLNKKLRISTVINNHSVKVKLRYLTGLFSNPVHFFIVPQQIRYAWAGRSLGTRIWSGVTCLWQQSVEAAWCGCWGKPAFALRSWHWDTFRASGVLSRALTLLGVGRFITWRLGRPFLGECQQDPRYSFEYRASLRPDPP